ncbi:MAG: hypothetical protein KKD73_07820 [Proteobacteria bacterium]|nr:hypothetical protein [Pseudomonadota bacterium]MBU1639533.1 hypothetical protein [Pseudomonadota bacterium]
MATDFFTLEVAIPCDCGHLQGRLLYGEEGQQGPGLIICPPHPLLAGNMDNNVVAAIAETMAATMPVLLFNYRAVGTSSHPQPELPLYEYWHGLDARHQYDDVVADARQVMAWSRDYFPAFHLLGYSFGSYIALRALADRALSYTAITPPLGEHDFSALAALHLPCGVVLAEKDGLLDRGKQQLPDNIHCLHILKCTDHFFVKREAEVATLVADFIHKRVALLEIL